jgi:hypothetical protein
MLPQSRPKGSRPSLPQPSTIRRQDKQTRIGYRTGFACRVEVADLKRAERPNESDDSRSRRGLSGAGAILTYSLIVGDQLAGNRASRKARLPPTGTECARSAVTRSFPAACESSAPLKQGAPRRLIESATIRPTGLNCGFLRADLWRIGHIFPIVNCPWLHAARNVRISD